MKLTRRRFVRGIIFVCNPFDEDQSEERKRRDDQHDLSLFFLQFSETKKRTFINETTIFRGPSSRPSEVRYPTKTKNPSKVEKSRYKLQLVFLICVAAQLKKERKRIVFKFPTVKLGQKTPFFCSKFRFCFKDGCI